MEQFGKYQFLEPLAKGGMAETYRARFSGAAGVTKDVVIKKILPLYADDKSFVAMFVNEAKIAATFSHGNIAQVFDFGEIDGEYFLAMEFVDGRSLQQIFKRARQMDIRSVAIPLALHIAIKMCEGLHYAHTRVGDDGRPLRIVHRDVAPDNVLISYEGQVKLVDFGIAKALTEGRDQTEPGMVKGKYLYFSPEQARGENVDARTDIFSTGVVLYQMLCGRLPFEGQAVQVMQHIVTDDVPSPRAHNPAISPALERILLRALSKKPEERFPTAQAFGEALSGYLYGEEPTFSPTRLASFMAYVFQETLTAEGRKVEIPSEFLEQLELWKRVPPPAQAPARPSRRVELPQPPLPPPPAGVTQEQNLITAGGITKPLLPPPSDLEPPTGESTQQLDATIRIDPPDLSGSRLTTWTWVLGVVFVVAVVLPLILLRVLRPPETNPATQVEVVPPVETPLPPHAAHSPEVAVALSPDKPPPTSEEPPATTPPPDGPPPEPVAPESPTAVTPAVAPKPEETPPLAEADEARFPVPSFKVVAQRHFLSVTNSHAAFLKLDSGERYRIWAEGSLSFEKDVRPSSKSVLYLTKGKGGAPGVAGMIGPRPGVVLDRVEGVYAMVVDPLWQDNLGSVVLHVEMIGGSRKLRLVVDARRNAIRAEARQQFVLHGLDSHKNYRMTIREPKEAGSRDARPRMACTAVTFDRDQANAVTGGQRICEAGGVYDVTDSDGIEFTFLGQQGDLPQGELEVEVRRVH